MWRWGKIFVSLQRLLTILIGIIFICLYKQREMWQLLVQKVMSEGAQTAILHENICERAKKHNNLALCSCWLTNRIVVTTYHFCKSLSCNSYITIKIYFRPNNDTSLSEFKITYNIRYQKCVLNTKNWMAKSRRVWSFFHAFELDTCPKGVYRNKP